MLNLFFYKNKNILIFISLISISLFSMSQSSEKFRKLLGDFFSVVTYPFTLALHETSTFIEDTYSNFVYFQDKLDEIEKIKGMLKETKRIEKDNKHLIDQIIKLKEQLNYFTYQEKAREIFNNQEYIPVESAEVIMRDRPGNLFGSIILNKGKKHGIKENMPVIAFQVVHDLPDTPMSKVVVGRIKEVSYMASKLLPVNSPDCIIHAGLKGHPFTGFVEGRGHIEKGLLFTDLDRRTNIKIGEEVITTGGQSLFPSGIRVGIIVKDFSNETDFMKKAIVKPYVDLSRLDYVFIVKKELSALAPLLEK